jgi:hypothetical protein
VRFYRIFREIASLISLWKSGFVSKAYGGAAPVCPQPALAAPTRVQNFSYWPGRAQRPAGAVKKAARAADMPIQYCKSLDL